MTAIFPGQRPRKAVLTLHIASAVALLGVDLCLVLLAALGLAGADPQTVYPAAYLIAAWLLRPLALASLATGMGLALLTGWRLFTYWWTTIKFAIAAGLSLASIFVLAPALGAAASATAAPDQPLAENGLALLAAPAIASALLSMALALSVIKPRWRLRRA